MGRRRTHDAPIDIVLPITPMLDMSFQLLAFFVMTFRVVGPAEGELDMYLPKAGEAKAKVPDAVDLSKTSDADIDQSSDLSVVIEATSGGDVSKLLVKDKAASHPVDDVKALQAKLKQMRGDLANKGNIKIEAESKLKYARLVAVMDACLAAGFTQVGFAPPPDLGPK